LNVPDTVGVPLIVMVFEANAAVTPAGNPVAVPIPVAPVVAWVISVNTVLIHNVGVDDAVCCISRRYSHGSCSRHTTSSSIVYTGCNLVTPTNSKLKN
jgi:hypothetical protein